MVPMSNAVRGTDLGHRLSDTRQPIGRTDEAVFLYTNYKESDAG